jgi:hypothetical protein
MENSRWAHSNAISQDAWDNFYASEIRAQRFWSNAKKECRYVSLVKGEHEPTSRDYMDTCERISCRPTLVNVMVYPKIANPKAIASWHSQGLGGVDVILSHRLRHCRR